MKIFLTICCLFALPVGAVEHDGIFLMQNEMIEIGNYDPLLHIYQIKTDNPDEKDLYTNIRNLMQAIKTLPENLRDLGPQFLVGTTYPLTEGLRIIDPEYVKRLRKKGKPKDLSRYSW